jgi:hypothetical protein
MRTSTSKYLIYLPSQHGHLQGCFDYHKSETQAIKNALVSARAVVEKEMMVEFAKNPLGSLSVKDNLIRVMQRKKQPEFPQNPVDLRFE